MDINPCAVTWSSCTKGVICPRGGHVRKARSKIIETGNGNELTVTFSDVTHAISNQAVVTETDGFLSNSCENLEVITTHRHSYPHK